MRKKWIFAAALLAVLAILAALIAVGLARADDAHELVAADYRATAANVAASALTVTENGALIGTYSLTDLGLRDAVLAEAVGPYSAVDRMEPEAFAHLGIRTRLSWLRETHPAAREIAITAENCDLSAVMDDLLARRRTPAQDAQVVFSDGKYQIAPEQLGTELDETAVRAALLAQVAAMKLTTGADGAPAAATCELTDAPCYLPPEVTADTIEFDPAACLSRDLSGKSLTVYLLDTTETLDETQLKALLSVSADGILSVDEAAVTQFTAEWAQQADLHGVPYRFMPYSEVLQELSFLPVDYTIDQPKLAERITSALRALDFNSIDALWACTRNGEPFTIADTYVEVDIDSQTMTFYKDGKCLVHTSVVTGALDGHQTPTGFYHVENKDTDCWLSGPDYLVFVKYWVGVYGPYGLHDASWRENFGGDYYVYGGSHGCVNTPDSAMKKIYDNIEVGDPVVIFGKNQWYEPAQTN